MPQTFSDDSKIYSVDMMFAFLNLYSYPVTEINVKDYTHNMEYDSWADKFGNKYSAKDVLKSPKKYKDEIKRIERADLSYPIIITPTNNIADGLHRLTKAVMEKREKINAYIFDKEIMDRFKIGRISKKSWEKSWEKVDSIKSYELIIMFNERFADYKMEAKDKKYVKYKTKYIRTKMKTKK